MQAHARGLGRPLSAALHVCIAAQPIVPCLLVCMHILDVSFCMELAAASGSWLATVLAHGTGTHPDVDSCQTDLNFWSELPFVAWAAQSDLGETCMQQPTCNGQHATADMCTILDFFSDLGCTCRLRHQAPGHLFTGHWHCRTIWQTSQQSQRAWLIWPTSLAHSWAFSSAEQMLHWCPPSASCLPDICTRRGRKSMLSCSTI